MTENQDDFTVKYVFFENPLYKIVVSCKAVEHIIDEYKLQADADGNIEIPLRMIRKMQEWDEANKTGPGFKQDGLEFVPFGKARLN
jgi:hypothetical protein